MAVAIVRREGAVENGKNEERRRGTMASDEAPWDGTLISESRTEEVEADAIGRTIA